MKDFILYSTIVYILVWFIQTQLIFDRIFITEFLKEVRKCDYCIGTWVAIFIYWFFRIEFINIYIDWIIVPIIVTTLNHFIRAGYRSEHGIIKL